VFGRARIGRYVYQRRPYELRTRLISFFVVISIVPMAAVGFLVFRLIDDSQSGKPMRASAESPHRASSLYVNASRQQACAPPPSPATWADAGRRLRSRAVTVARQEGSPA